MLTVFVMHNFVVAV